MPTYEMTAPNGRTYRIVGPAGATDAQVKAKILAQFPDSAKPAGRTRGSGIGPIDTTLDTINEMLIGVPTGMYNAAAMVTDPLMRLIVGDKAVTQAQGQRQRAVNALSNTFVTQPRPLARLVGESIGPGAAVSRTATLAAPILQKIPLAGNTLANVARATASGGIGVKAPTATARTRLRLAGGGTSGAATSALTGQDVTTGTLTGAGIPILGSVLKQITGRAIDLTRMPAVKAGKIIRESLGKNVAAARAAFARLSPDDQRLAMQVMVDEGIEPSAFFGVGGIVQREIDPDMAPGVLKRDEVSRKARLAEIAGGGTMEDIRAAVRGERAAVTKELEPVREEMYRRSGVASEVVPVAERIASQATQAADEITASGIVPRTRAFENRGQEQIDAAFQNPELFTLGGPIPRTAALVDRAGQVADDAIAAQLQLRDTARDLYQMVDDMAAEGMTPMRAADLISSLRRKLNDPEILHDSLEENTIKGVIGQLQKATDANGMLNPKALGKIRRSGLGDLVNTLSVKMGGVPSRTGTPEAAQKTVLELRNLIDDTLRKGGGGDLVDEFLQRSERGYAAVNRQELAGEAFRRLEDDPTGATFRKLVRGGEPELVGQIMGGGPENEIIANAFAGDPIRLGRLQTIAQELDNLEKLGELQNRGATVASGLLTGKRPSYLSRGLREVASVIAPRAAYGAQGANQIQTALLSPKVKQELATAYESGPNMARAMNQFPTAVRLSEQAQQTNPITRNFLAQLFNQSFNQ